jgi:RNA polymerase sigma factor (sigma-70 family)
MIISRAVAAASAGLDRRWLEKLRAMTIFFLQLPRFPNVMYMMAKRVITLDEFAPPAPPPRPQDEEACLLVARVQAGDRLAFRQFIEKYQRLVAAIVFRMVYNSADREEICQDVFLKIFAHIGRFEGGCRVSAWIGRIAANTCINHLRKKRLPLYDDIAGPEADLGNVPGDGPTPERLNEQADLNSSLQEEIGRLPLHYLPAGTVKSHLFRARQMLRQRLAITIMEGA